MQDKIEVLERELEALRSEVTRLKRIARREAKLLEPENPRLVDARSKIERILAEGDVCDPLVPWVDLEDFVGSDLYEHVLANENAVTPSVSTSIRGISIEFSVPNRKALWQSVGQEFIEPELLDFIDELDDNDIYFDIGASTGVFALYSASRGVRTVAIEPECNNFGLLNDNIDLNRDTCGNMIAAYNIAMSNAGRIDKIFMRETTASFHEKILGENRTRDGAESFTAKRIQNVLVNSLDEFCAIAQIWPTALKIDVDGSELELLNGMPQLLASSQLKKIFIEISVFEETSLSALEFLLKHRFRVQRKKRVQNYFSEFNYILTRD